jgi:hypothetical protein
MTAALEQDRPPMLAPDDLKRDRHRYHAHAATFFLGLAGWLLVATFETMISPPVVPWLLVASSLLLTASGVLAISVGRTLMSGPAHDLGPADPYEDPGDALVTPGIWTLDFWPSWTRAVAPYAFLGAGLVFLALSGWWALGGMP